MDEFDFIYVDKPPARIRTTQGKRNPILARLAPILHASPGTWYKLTKPLRHGSSSGSIKHQLKRYGEHFQIVSRKNSEDGKVYLFIRWNPSIDDEQPF